MGRIMTRRQSTAPDTAPATAQPFNTEPGDTLPTLLPLPGTPVKARTTLDYNLNMDTEHLRPDLGKNDLEDLIELTDTDLAPPDALTQFCETFAHYQGYAALHIVRLPDPGDKRQPGNRFNSPNLNTTVLGNIPFEPVTLIDSVRILNGNSGGLFRIWLSHYENNQRIPEATFDGLLISDPPRDFNAPRGPLTTQAGGYQQPDIYSSGFMPPPPTPVKSDADRLFERLQAQLMQRMVDQLTNPPPAATVNNLSADDQATLAILKNTDVLGNVIQRILTLVQAPERAVETSWKDKLADAAFTVAQNNPQIVERISETLERVINTVLGPRQSTQPLQQPQPVLATRATPAPRLVTARPLVAAVNTGLPEVPDLPHDDPEFDEESEFEMIDALVTFLTGNEPITADNPILIQLRTEYPNHFPRAIAMIAVSPMPLIINWLKAQSQLYDSLLNGPLSTHIIARIGILKTLCEQATGKVNNDTVIPADNESPAS